MLISEEKLVQIAEAMAAGELAISRAAIQCGVARRTVFNWLEQSKAGSEETLIRWPGDEPIQFYRALSIARDMASLDVRGTFERRCLVGTEEKVFFQGKPTWVEIEECVGLDEDTREMLGYPRDGILRDALGRRVQHTIRHAPPVAAVVKFLEARFADEYRPRSETSLSVNGGLSIGVTSVPVPALPKRGDPAPVVPPPPRRPMIAAPIEDAEFTEPDVPDTSPMATTATEPTTDPVDEDFQAPQSAKVETVIRTATPPEYQATAIERSGQPLSPLARDLLSRLRSPNPSANPVGSIAAVKPMGAGE